MGNFSKGRDLRRTRELTDSTDDERLEDVTAEPDEERRRRGDDELDLANNEDSDLLSEVGLVRVRLAGTLVLRLGDGEAELLGVVRRLLRSLVARKSASLGFKTLQSED